MTLLLSRRVLPLSIPKFRFSFLPKHLICRSHYSKIIPSEAAEDGLSSPDGRPKDFASNSSRVRLSPLFPNNVSPSFNIKRIEVVDAETWKVSASLSRTWQGTSNLLEDQRGLNADEMVEEDEERLPSLSVEGEEDFDEIDNMRIRGNLFYKLEKASKEFEEYSLEFHRKKSSKGKEDQKESKKKDQPRHNPVSSNAKLPKATKKNIPNFATYESDLISDVNGRNKKLRTPTFNQLTGPYHEPFCLDVYISKASVRACVIHRVTSKVVAVAHSISKDMKFDLASTRNAAACAAVGEILARRALADDIHDMVYTPRKGEKLEGKLMVVLQAIIDGGVNVKVKLKQRRKSKKATNFSNGTYSF